MKQPKKKKIIYTYIYSRRKWGTKQKTEKQNQNPKPSNRSYKNWEREKWIPEMGFVWGIIFGQIRNKKKESCKNLENPKTMGR